MTKRALLVFPLAILLTSLACVQYVYDPHPDPYRPAHPPVEVEVGVFYDALSPHGDWIWVGSHGWVWTPHSMPWGWRPYTQGHWVHTPHGWTWVSDWAWGWAPFHYGRWTHDHHHGWVWVPDWTWGPAWVTWRHGGGWIGWAPLPPGVHWSVGVGLDFGGLDLHVAIGSFWWSYVPDRRFVDLHIHHHLASAARNHTLARVTRTIGHWDEWNGRPRARSIEPREVERVTRRAVPRRTIEEVTRPHDYGGDPEREGVLRVYRPDKPTLRRKAAPKAAPGTAPEAAPKSGASEDPTASRRGLPGNRDLDVWSRGEREKLSKAQQRESARPPNDVSADDLKKRHDAEKAELEKVVERERRALEGKQKRHERKPATDTRRKAVPKKKKPPT